MLGTRIDIILDRVPKEGRYGSAIVTRFANVCEGHGIETVWMLTVYRGTMFGKFKNAGPGTVALAEETLEDMRCTFDAFPQLRSVLEEVATGVDRRRLHIDFPEVLMALAGIGDWAKEPAIIAALAEHGLRPGMPLEELFVYVSVVTEPKKLTVAEELLAFGAMSAWSVLPASDTDLDLNPDRTIIELWAELAVWPEPASPIIVQRRNELIAAARRHLSPEALMRIGYVEE